MSDKEIKSSVRFKGAILTILGASCWGLSGSVGQYLFDVQGMDSRWLVPIRLGFAGILILLYCIFKYKNITILPWKSKESAIALLVYGILGVSCCQFLYFLTIQLSNAAIGTILQDLAPIFILIYTCLTTKRLPHVFEIISIGLAIIGVFLITTHGQLDSTNVSSAALIAGILSAVGVMIYNVMAPSLTDKFPVIILQGWSFLMGGVLSFLLFRTWTINYVPNIYGFLGIIFVIVVGNIGAFTLYISGVSLIGPQKAILYSFAEPITAALISTFVLGLKFTFFDGLGFGMIFLMLYLISARKE